ncbi:MAG: RNA polymerase sigma factor SigM [Nocardioidaceae bacterium]|nr:RNA polymerase sigma factor SigM [Nocardioidaceae bacterium]
MSGEPGDRLDQRSDVELLQAHVDGDPEAFAEVVRRHQGRLWAVALRTLGDREEAADALQDAMVKAFRSAASFRGDAQVTTWLHRVVVNACIDRARRRAVRPADPLPDDPDRLAALATTDGDPATDRQRRVDVLAALQQLPVDQRAALVLVDMEGYSIDEAADLLETRPGTVKSRCSRGRAGLAPLLEDWRNQVASPSVPSPGPATGAQARAPGPSRIDPNHADPNHTDPDHTDPDGTDPDPTEEGAP